MKTLILAALLAGTAASANAAVTFNFSGAEFEGAAVSGSITIDTDALAGANGATDPALDYYFSTGDTASTVASPFLSVSFSSAGVQPNLLSAGTFTTERLVADPADGSFLLEVDWSVTNLDGSTSSSLFSVSAFDLTATTPVDGVLLPDFSQGTFFYQAMSGDGVNQDLDLTSLGQISFVTTAAVPEASTWAMMMLGFGAVGYAARRRARVAFA